jgi:sarcosine oxidase subunit delta
VLRIACPYCGLRDEVEFRFGGPAHVARPGLEVDDATWADYLFVRENPAGLNFERWCHSYGCGSWFNLVRNTLTHEILLAYRMDSPKPALRS